MTPGSATFADGPLVHLLPVTHDAGAENQALYLLDALRSRLDGRIELAYFAAGRNHYRFRALNFPMHHVPRRHRLPLDLYPRSRRLRHVYATRSPALLHTWLFEANAVGLLAARNWPDTRVIVTHRSGDVITNAKSVALRFMLRRADHALANSTKGAEAMVRAGMDEARITVLPSGVPEERITVQRTPAEVRAALDIDLDAPVVGFVGRVDPSKDLATLFGAMDVVWSRRPDVILLLVGPSAAELRELRSVGRERVVAMGWQSQPADYMNASDAVAISSATEGHANVASEALLLGLPVATTDTGGHAPIVAQCGGRVVPTRSPHELGQALVGLLDRPPDRPRVIAAARERLGFSEVVNTTLEIYQRVLDTASVAA